MRRRPLMNLTNLILNTDSYKFSHYLQYPPETQAISSYVEARGHSDHAEVLFFGLQMFLKEYLSKPVTLSDIDEAEAIVRDLSRAEIEAAWREALRGARLTGVLTAG